MPDLKHLSMRKRNVKDIQYRLNGKTLTQKSNEINHRAVKFNYFYA